MTKPRPKTGERRAVNQPLKIDRLPQSARDAIKVLYDQGRTWKEIEEQSALGFGPDWSKPPYDQGFIDWTTIDSETLDLFPGLRVAKNTLHRWFDLRVRQVRAQVLAESAKARKWAEAFAGKDLPGTNAAVMNAMRDQVFTLMRQVGPGDQAKFLDGLNALSLTLARLQRVELQAKRVEVDSRKLKLLEEREEQQRQQLEAETEGAARKLSKGELTVEDINRLRERVFGLPPVEAPEAARG
jgi:hypothetical protein